MATYLRINPGTHPAAGKLTGLSVRIPANVDLEDLARDLTQCVENDECLMVEAEAEDDPRISMMLFINGKTVTTALLTTLSEDR